MDEQGTIDNQYDYDLFGSPTLTIELYESTIRYSGEFYDAEVACITCGRVIMIRM